MNQLRVFKNTLESDLFWWDKETCPIILIEAQKKYSLNFGKTTESTHFKAVKASTLKEGTYNGYIVDCSQLDSIVYTESQIIEHIRNKPIFCETLDEYGNLVITTECEGRPVPQAEIRNKHSFFELLHHFNKQKELNVNFGKSVGEKISVFELFLGLIENKREIKEVPQIKIIEDLREEVEGKILFIKNAAGLEIVNNEICTKFGETVSFDCFLYDCLEIFPELPEIKTVLDIKNYTALEYRKIQSIILQSLRKQETIAVILAEGFKENIKKEAAFVNRLDANKNNINLRIKEYAIDGQLFNKKIIK